mgnify:CR=1 FL=1
MSLTDTTIALLQDLIRNGCVNALTADSGQEAKNADTLEAFFAERGYADLQLWPMTRARLVALNGREVTVDSFDDPETQRWINRDFKQRHQISAFFC